MTDALAYASVFGVGIVASVMGTMVGGGSLLSIPLLIFLGLPPQVAIATDRFAALGGAITALHQFARSKKVVWRWVPILAALSLGGSLVGARVLVDTDPNTLRNVVGALLIALLPFLFLRPDIGVDRARPTRLRVAAGLALYLGVETLAGFFHGGAGTLIIFILITFFRITIVEVAATQLLPFIALAASSSLLFAAHGLIDYRMGLVLLAGTAVGGFLGARIAVRRGDAWVRRLFALAVLGIALSLLIPSLR